MDFWKGAYAILEDIYGDQAAGNVLTVGSWVNMDENSQCIIEQES
jgi:hypothetical protein